MSGEHDRQRERDRQQALLQVLWRQQAGDALKGWTREVGSAGTERGLQAYRANAGASAERALAARYPTVQALIGEEGFGALARSHWLAHPPARGDLACFGEALAGDLASDERWAAWPYLADCARLDDAVFAAECAADALRDGASFASLAEADPEALQLRLAPGARVLRSTYPIVTIFDAHHQPDAGAAFDSARSLLGAGTGECALVWRDGWKARVCAIDDADATWMEAILGGRTVGQALQQASAGFDFERWLLDALQRQWLLGVTRLDAAL